MRYLVTGAGGMLGHELLRGLAGRDVTAASRADLDITDAGAVRDAVRGQDVVINAAAYTDVDGAEQDEAAAFAVNGVGPGLLATACRSVGATLVHLSTDYVFDGTSREPYAEDSERSPVSSYGRSKAEGELRVLEGNGDRTYLVRTAWLYGSRGPNFASTMLRLSRERDTVSVVTDQTGQPTSSADLARRILLLLDDGAPFGIYHGTNSGSATWFEFAQKIFDTAGLDPARVTPVTSDAFPRPAPRPLYSVLGHQAWEGVGIAPMRDWRMALRDWMTDMSVEPA